MWVVVVKMCLRKLWGENGIRDVEVQPNRGVVLSHESDEATVSDRVC